jgi:patatin-like phospholipase/acyl hydrolase
MATFSPAESLRLLSLDGGGIKGLTSLLILKRIFRTLRELGHYDEEPKPCEVFDLIAGTSTGGLIAVMLGRLHMSIDECITVYERVGKRVFGKKPSGGQAGRLFKGLINSPFYDIRILQECMKDILQEREVPIDESFRETGFPQCKV